MLALNGAGVNSRLTICELYPLGLMSEKSMEGGKGT